MAFWGSFVRSGRFTDEMPSMPKKPKTPSSKAWTNCSQIVGFHFPMCLQQCSPADASLQCMAVPQHSCTQMGRRRWPPPGGVQSAAHRRCAGRAELKSHRPQPKLQTYHKGPSSRWQAQVLCQALGPLSFSLPRSLGTTADPAPRSGNLLLCGFFFDFLPFQVAIQILHRKNIEKNAKKLRK